jgi:5-(hydroxymethyl)furfural/furfural oxidase
LSNFDHVIVGAGSAGCLLAARLSATPETSVLLLESGADLRPADEPPAMRDRNPMTLLTGAQFGAHRYDDILARRTSLQAPAPYQRGRGVGGSSNVNGHVAVRGEVPDDYDAWARAGCAGWSGAEVLPIFVALESDVDYGSRPYHGIDGPLPICRAPRSEWSPLDRVFCDAALAEGYPWCEDINAPDSTGVSPFAHALRDNTRVSANTTFLEGARARPNLEIRADSHVERVLFEGSRTCGISIDGEVIEARHVILAAGAVHSPTILMRSGVGPADHLRSVGVEVLRDAPVGENLLDHTILWLGARLDENDRDTRPTRFANIQIRYSSGLVGAGRNDMMLGTMNIPASAGMDPAHGLLAVANWQEFSRGVVRLRAADAREQPSMEMRMLSDERDRVRMRDGARRMWKLRQHDAVAELVQEVFTFPAGDRVDELPAEDDQLDAWIASICQESAHASGTCRMGAVDDPRSVVDPDCRVIGFEGLRVIDASVFPEVPRGNTQLPTLMVAEMMARRLLQANGG